MGFDYAICMHVWRGRGGLHHSNDQLLSKLSSELGLHLTSPQEEFEEACRQVKKFVIN